MKDIKQRAPRRGAMRGGEEFRLGWFSCYIQEIM
jgi:hypothetical protein